MKAIVWSTSNCPFCEQAKSLLRNKGYEVEEKKIGVGYTREDLLSILPTVRTVPQIFLNEEYIGGINDLQLRLATC